MALHSITNFFPISFINDPGLHRSLGEEFALCDNGNMVFHWADFHETCDSVKEHLKISPSLMEDFKKRDISIARLGLIPVWVRTSRRIFQMTMFALYEKFILDQVSMSSDLDPFGPIEISFISGTGPFKEMSIAECFSPITYRDFVLVYLIQDKLPKRDYRIRLKSKVLVEFGKEFEKARLINLEQMTANGLLLSCDSDFYMNELSENDSMRVLVDTKTLKNSLGLSLEDLQTHLSQHTFNLMYSSLKDDAIECPMSAVSTQSSLDFLRNRKVYLFVAYDKIADSAPMSAKCFRDFIDYSRDLIRKHYRDMMTKSA
jgi:hypothetical protein